MIMCWQRFETIFRYRSGFLIVSSVPRTKSKNVDFRSREIFAISSYAVSQNCPNHFVHVDVSLS